MLSYYHTKVLRDINRPQALRKQIFVPRQDLRARKKEEKMKKFKVTKILAAVLAAMMLTLSIALVGCSSDSDDLAYIKKNGLSPSL